MAAPTSIAVSVDQDEYSRFEKENDVVGVLIRPEGTDLNAEQITVEFMKARRNRDVAAATKTLTLTSAEAADYEIEFDLTELVDSEEISVVRRGDYFIRATSVTNTSIVGESSDFVVSLITVDFLRKQYVHGIDQRASEIFSVREQPENITGVEVLDVSRGHPQAWFPLAYNLSGDAATVTGTVTETFTLVDGNILLIQVDGGASQTVTFNTADFSDINAATAAEVAAVINVDTTGITAADVGGSVQLTSDTEGPTSSILVATGSTAAAALGLTGANDTSDLTRLLSWCGGPAVAVHAGKRKYTLRKGSNSTDWIEVRVRSIAGLPLSSTSDELLIEKKKLGNEEIKDIISKKINEVEDTLLSVFLEPTRIVTQIDPNNISFDPGTDIPTFVQGDWDCVVDAITYYVPSAGHWINIKFPYYPLLRINEMYGEVSNVRVLDVALEWLEIKETSGFVELVPFNQEIAFNFIGLVWIESIRGPVPIPNFWNFDAIVGFRKTPPAILELIAKLAAIDVLTIAGQAFRGGFSSQSVSRDGVSESVSYTASAIYGIYSATIEDYRKWIKETLKKLKGRYRGPDMLVV